MKYALLILAFMAVAVWSYTAGTLYNALEPVKTEPKCDEVVEAKNVYTGKWDTVCEIVLSSGHATPQVHPRPSADVMTGHDLQPAMTVDELKNVEEIK